MLKQKLSKGSDKFKLKFEKRQQFTRVVWAPSQAAGQDRTRSSSTVTCIRPLNTEQLMYIVGQSFVVVFLLRLTVTGLLHSTAIAYLCTSHIWAFFDPTIDRLIVRCVDQSSRGSLVWEIDVDQINATVQIYHLSGCNTYDWKGNRRRRGTRTRSFAIKGLRYRLK